VRFFRDREELRTWFVENHGQASELWIGYYKKGVSRRGVNYPEAVEEALCFGWIDGQVRSLDERSYANRYTPRAPSSRWSVTNLAKAKELAAAGRMHPAGLAALAARGEPRRASYLFEQGENAWPAELEQQFRSQRVAWSFFSRQPPGYRKLWTRWVVGARRPETQRRRLEVLISASARSRRMDPLRPFPARDGRPAHGGATTSRGRD
jgi:uncharacterized protein YdeI (YjbR/CyaY-like superfamily)